MRIDVFEEGHSRVPRRIWLAGGLLTRIGFGEGEQQYISSREFILDQ